MFVALKAGAMLRRRHGVLLTHGQTGEPKVDINAIPATRPLPSGIQINRCEDLFRCSRNRVCSMNYLKIRIFLCKMGTYPAVRPHQTRNRICRISNWPWIYLLDFNRPHTYRRWYSKTGDSAGLSRLPMAMQVAVFPGRDGGCINLKHGFRYFTRI